MFQWPSPTTVRTLQTVEITFPISYTNKIYTGLATQYSDNKSNSVDCNPQFVNFQLDRVSLYGNLSRTDQFYGNMTMNILLIGI